MKNGETKHDEANPDLMAADIQVVVDCLMAKKPVPTDVAERIHKRSEQIRQRVFEEFGLLDIAVPSIRELRGELPEP